MYRWSKLPEEVRPEIIFDVTDHGFLTLIVRNSYKHSLHCTRKFLIDAAARRKDCFESEIVAINVRNVSRRGVYEDNRASRGFGAADIVVAAQALECDCTSSAFKNIIYNNVACTVMHKVKNSWAPEVDTVVVFMTGNFDDVFLVHPKDLTEWNLDEV